MRKEFILIETYEVSVNTLYNKFHKKHKKNLCFLCLLCFQESRNLHETHKIVTILIDF